MRKIKGSWWVDFRWQNDRLRKRSPLNTKGGAQDYELQLRKYVALHGSIEHAMAALNPAAQKPAPTFAEFSARWMQHFVDGKNKPGECRNKRSALAVHLVPALGRLPLAGITSEEVEKLKSSLLERPLSAKTINNHLTVLRKCLDVAVECGELASVPRIRQLKTLTPPFRFLDRTEVDSLLKHAADRDWQLLILAAVRTGMRFGELTALRWEDVDLTRGLIYVRRSRYLRQETAPKNNRTRVVPITSDLGEALQSRPSAPSTYVFERRGQPIPWETARKALATTCGRAGIKRLGWHVLRHTFASELAQRGVTIQVIRELLGHATIQMTLRYAHLSQDALREAVAHLATPNALGNSWAASGQPPRLEASLAMVAVKQPRPILARITAKAVHDGRLPDGRDDRA